MNGDFGAIYQDGKHVGGFLNWTIAFDMADTSRDGVKAYTVTKWRARAKPFYWIAPTSGDIYTVDFYIYYEQQLLLASRNLIDIDRNLSDDLHKWIDRGLEMKLA